VTADPSSDQEGSQVSIFLFPCRTDSESDSLSQRVPIKRERCNDKEKVTERGNRCPVN
jgi:hypothetical protein